MYYKEFIAHIFKLISHAFRLVKCSNQATYKYNCKFSTTFRLGNNFSQHSFV